MKNQKNVFVFASILAFTLVLFAGFSSAVILAEWPSVSSGTASNVNSDVTAGTLTSGSGVSLDFDSTDARATGWSDSASPNSEEYFQITIAPNAGKTISISALNFMNKRSETGPANYQIQYSKQVNFASPTVAATRSNVDTTDQDGSLTGLNIQVNSGETLTIRLYGYGATSTAGVWRILENTLKIEGTVTTAPVSLLQLTKVRDVTSSQTGIFTVKNTGTSTLTNIVFTDAGAFNVEFSQVAIASLAPGATSSQITITPTDLATSGFQIKTVTVTATAADSTTGILTFSVGGSFCSAGEKGGKLDIRNIKIDNNGEGKDDEWNLLDEIEVEVEVENTAANDDVDDVFIEIGLFDSTGNNVITDLDFDNTDEEGADVGNMNDGDKETVTYTFRVPADIEDGSYKLTVKAYSDNIGESLECTDTSSDLDQTTYQKIDVQRESDEGKFIAFENTELSSTEFTCGDLVTLSTDVFNIGDEDQDQVLVTLFNNELKIKESYEIRNDVDQGDNEAVTFSFSLPQDATNKIYQFELLSEYDYKNNNYRQKADSTAKVPIKVIGCSATGSGTGSGTGTGSTSDRFVAISASLDSSATAGEELVVRATITNLLSQDASFAIGVDGYQDWASLGGISERILPGVNGGESKEVTIRLKVNDDASGEQSFIIEVGSEEKSQTREVVVNLQESQASSKGFNLGSNAYLWIIGVINVVLIILIIVVAIRISRR